MVRKLYACEVMGGANIICSDKTGTLTRNKMFWTHFYNTKERIIFDPKTDKPLLFESYIPQKESRDLFLNTIVLNSIEDPKKKDGNPTEMALLKYIDICGINVVEYRN